MKLDEKINELIFVGMRLKYNGDLTVGSINLTREEVNEHPDYHTLLNKITDYIENYGYILQ